MSVFAVAPGAVPNPIRPQDVLEPLTGRFFIREHPGQLDQRNVLTVGFSGGFVVCFCLSHHGEKYTGQARHLSTLVYNPL